MPTFQEVIAANQRKKDATPVPSQAPEITNVSDISTGNIPSREALGAKERDLLSFSPSKFEDRLRNRLQEKFDEKFAPLQEQRAEREGRLEATFFDPEGSRAGTLAEREALFKEISLIDKKMNVNTDRMNTLVGNLSSQAVEQQNISLQKLQSLMKERKELEQEKKDEQARAFQQLVTKTQLGLSIPEGQEVPFGDETIKGLKQAPLPTSPGVTNVISSSNAQGVSSLANSRIIDGGASNGSGRINPVSFVPGFDFGSGQRGELIKDQSGNVVARITSPFGADHGNISGEKNHNGLDVVFNNGEVIALNGGTIIKKGYAAGTYGAYIWVQDADGNVLQYGHMSKEDVDSLPDPGKSPIPIEAGALLGRHETNKNLWGSSSGAHTDIRFVGSAGEPGTPEYSDEQKSVMRGLDPSKLNSTTLKVLENAGLTATDLFAFKDTDGGSVNLTPEKREQVETILEGIRGLKEHPGFSGAVGFSLQKVPFTETTFLPGLDTTGFIRKFNSFRDNLTLPSLESLKGAMSDKDIQFLRNSATSLALDLSEEEFMDELNRLEAKFGSLLMAGSSKSQQGDSGGVNISDLNFKF